MRSVKKTFSRRLAEMRLSGIEHVFCSDKEASGLFEEIAEICIQKLPKDVDHTES